MQHDSGLRGCEEDQKSSRLAQLDNTRGAARSKSTTVQVDCIQVGAMRYSHGTMGLFQTDLQGFLYRDGCT